MYQQQQQQEQEQQEVKPSRICRVCLSLVDECMEINTVEHSTGFMPYRDKLALVVPEMMLDMIQDPAICIDCSNELQEAYKFKQKCMQTEEKIRRLVQSYGGVIYSLDLSNIADRSKLKQKPQPPPPLLPKPKFPPAVILKVVQPKSKTGNNRIIAGRNPERKQQKVEIVAITKKEAGIVTKVKTNEECTILPSVSCEKQTDEIEFHAVNELSERNALEVDGPLLLPKSEEIVDEQGDPFCDITAAAPPTEDAKKNETFRAVCNFCGKKFIGLFCLRNHQKMCRKSNKEFKPAKIEVKPDVVEATNVGRRRKHKMNPYTAKILAEKERGKRITLPEHAKNLLQIWLYQHRDNPYPTDVDKMELVQKTNLTLVQVENWFINARRRILQKMLARGSKYEEKFLKKDDSNEEWMLCE